MQGHGGRLPADDADLVLVEPDAQQPGHWRAGPDGLLPGHDRLYAALRLRRHCRVRLHLLVNSLPTGQLLSALLALLVATVGIKLFHVYERYAFVPQICVLFIFIGVAGPCFDTSVQSTGSSSIISADRKSFFILSVSAPLAWSPVGAGFFVYFPPDAKRHWVFLSTLVHLAVGFFFPLLLGVGLACGSLTNAAWGAAYDTSLCALVIEALSPLGIFGKTRSVVLGLGLICNNAPGHMTAYSGPWTTVNTFTV